MAIATEYVYVVNETRTQITAQILGKPKNGNCPRKLVTLIRGVNAVPAADWAKIQEWAPLRARITEGLVYQQPTAELSPRVASLVKNNQPSTLSELELLARGFTPPEKPLPAELSRLNAEELGGLDRSQDVFEL